MPGSSRSSACRRRAEELSLRLMTTTTPIQCLCGAVKMELTGEPIAQLYCHCDDCQVWMHELWTRWIPTSPAPGSDNRTNPVRRRARVGVTP
jgi:hypothetical protein